MAKKQKVTKKSKAIRKEEEEPKILLADDDSSSEEEENEEPKEEAYDQSTEVANEDQDSSADQEVEPEPEPEPEPEFKSDGRYHNKQRCLTICSRGVTSRFRHLLEDLRTLIPHHKKDSKISAAKNDVGGIGAIINDVAEMRGCNSVLFLETRKRQDAYLWLGHTNQSSANGNGPSAKFLVENIHTMDELRLTGNCMRGSRPLLTFDSSFDQREELKLLKCLFTDIFGVPRGHPKSKPFVDRVMGFYYADGKIWVRNYQIVEEHTSNAKEAHLEKKLHGKAVNTSLVEIGPRFVLNPIRIFRGSFGGQTLYQNDKYVSPNDTRAAYKRQKGTKFSDRRDAQKKRKFRKEQIVIPEDPLDSVFKR